MADGGRPDDCGDCQQRHAVSALVLGRRGHRTRRHLDPLPRRLCDIYELSAHSFQAEPSGR